jgi:hypothetical protein
MNPLVLALIVLLFICELSVFIYRLQIFLDVKKKTYAGLVGISSIATSALFTAVAGTLVLLTQSGDALTCEITILTCIFLYTSTKFQLYLSFIERMHVVHRNPSKTRVQSPLYILNMCLLAPYIGILTLMVVYRVSYIDENNDCRIGLLDASTLTHIENDTTFSVYSVGVFVWPLCKTRSLSGSEKLIMVAKKNVMVNVLVMNYLISGGGQKKDTGGSTTYTLQQQTSDAADVEVSFRDKSTSSRRVHPMTINPARLVSNSRLAECLTEDEGAATAQKIVEEVA